MNNFQLTATTMGLVIAASLAACQKPAPAVDKGKIADAVKADWERIATALNAGDDKTAVSSDAPDIVNIFHGQPTLIGPDADLKNTQQEFASGGKIKYADETVDVADAGDMAVLRSTYDATYTDPKTKKTVTEHGTNVVGYKKQADGSWKIAWTIGADTPPAAATPAVAPAKS